MSKKLFLSLAVVLLAVSSARAYVREIYGGVAVEWTKNRTVRVYLSIDYPFGPFTDGFATLNDSAEDALNTWNQQLVHMQFAPIKNSPLPAADGDANTSVTMSNKMYGTDFGKGVLAVTLVSHRGASLLEADVIFNSVYSWDSYRGALMRDQDVMDFHRVALHEFGHVLGLDHPDEANPKQAVNAIMNSHISSIDSLRQDDTDGAHSIYDSGPALLSSNPAPNLVNLSTRAFVGTGNNVVIGGFIIQGSQPATVVLRGIGGSLPGLGINNALEDPVIELHSGASTIAESDDWVDDSWASTIASYHLDPTNSRESAILATLNPGSYTVVLRSYPNSDGNLTGTGLIELYDLHTTGGRAGNISTRGPVSSG
ncbi:MAG: matrixin family metalloprotease, partial [Verrucomicrobiota bacterium]|nr:matrixin family metalloprotease [Verrucomicrobiota bacterium]